MSSYAEDDESSSPELLSPEESVDVFAFRLRMASRAIWTIPFAVELFRNLSAGDRHFSSSPSWVAFICCCCSWRRCSLSFSCISTFDGITPPKQMRTLCFGGSKNGCITVKWKSYWHAWPESFIRGKEEWRSFTHLIIIEIQLYIFRVILNDNFGLYKCILVVVDAFWVPMDSFVVLVFNYFSTMFLQSYKWSLVHVTYSVAWQACSSRKERHKTFL